MRNLMVFVFFLSLCSLSSLSNHVFAREVISSYLVSKEDVAKVADDFEVVEKKTDGFIVYVQAKKKAQFMQLAPNANLIQENIQAELWEQIQDRSTLEGYHNFDQVQATLRNWQEQYPQLVKIVPYGESSRGRPLVALKLAQNAGQDDPLKPDVMITAATHGNELITVEVILSLMEKLLQGYGQNEELTKFVNNLEIYFIPVVNPDGFTSQDRYDNGVDPNRAYPWPDSPQRNPSATIKNLITFFHAHDFKGSIDIHSSGKMIMFPWGYTYDQIEAADYDKWSELAGRMSQENGYANGPIAETIYVARGSSADYYYWKNRTQAFAYELTTHNSPPVSKIPSVVREIEAPTWMFLSSLIPAGN